MNIIGVTGSSGSGKSTVCKIISEMENSKIIDADEVAKSLDFPNSVYVKEIAKVFGEDVLNSEGKLNRKKLGNLIYMDIQNKMKLDKITFEYVVKEILKLLEVLKKEELDFIILDAPLLFEANLDKECDFIISVMAKENIKIDRIKTRDNVEEKIAKARLSIQKDDSFLGNHSDFIIENNEDIETVKYSVGKVLKDINEGRRI